MRRTDAPANYPAMALFARHRSRLSKTFGNAGPTRGWPVVLFGVWTADGAARSERVIR
jgi:hypothetical protein